MVNPRIHLLGEIGVGVARTQAQTPSLPTVGLWRFSLSVDGVETREDYVDKFFTEDATFGTLQNRFWVFNFPDGMTGTHNFSARWSGPCQPAVDSGLIAGRCEHPNDIVTLLARVVSVSFVAEEVSLATVR